MRSISSGSDIQNSLSDNQALIAPRSILVRSVIKEMENLSSVGKEALAFVLGKKTIERLGECESRITYPLYRELAEISVELFSGRRAEVARSYVELAERQLGLSGPEISSLENSLLLGLRGDIELKSGNFHEALCFYEQSLSGFDRAESIPVEFLRHRRGILNGMALSLIGTGEYKRGEEVFTQLLTSNHDSDIDRAKIILNFSILLARKGDPRDAASFLDLAIRDLNEIDSSEGKVLLARLLIFRGVSAVSTGDMNTSEILVSRAEDLLIEVAKNNNLPASALVETTVEFLICKLAQGETVYLDRYFSLYGAELAKVVFTDLDQGIKFLSVRRESLARTKELLFDIIESVRVSGGPFTPTVITNNLVEHGFEHRISYFFPKNLDFKDMSRQQLLQHIDVVLDRLVDECVRDDNLIKALESRPDYEPQH